MIATEQTYTNVCVELRRHVVAKNESEMRRWLKLANALIDCYPELIPDRPERILLDRYHPSTAQ